MRKTVPLSWVTHIMRHVSDDIKDIKQTKDFFLFFHRGCTWVDLTQCTIHILKLNKKAAIQPNHYHVNLCHSTSYFGDLLSCVMTRLCTHIKQTTAG